MRLIGKSRPGVEKLVAAAPQNERGMRSQILDDISSLFFKYGKVFVRVGMQIAGEHKLLPDHNSRLVAHLIKDVVIDKASAPEPENIHIRPFYKVDKLSVPLLYHKSGEYLGVYPV